MTTRRTSLDIYLDVRKERRAQLIEEFTGSPDDYRSLPQTIRASIDAVIANEGLVKLEGLINREKEKASACPPTHGPRSKHGQHATKPDATRHQHHDRHAHHPPDTPTWT